VAELTLYFDRNCGRRLPEALALLGLQERIVHHHTPKAQLAMRAKNQTEPLFPPEIEDDKWLSEIGQRGWIAFSHDRKFHKPGYEAELAALVTHSVGCFYLPGGSLRRHEKALVFLRAYSKIVQLAKSTPKPFIFSVAKNGKINQINIQKAKSKSHPKAKA
jgi:hypothetical protein